MRLTPGAGLFSHWILAHSQLAVTEEADGHPVRRSSDGMVRLRVPPGSRTRLSVQAIGPRSFRQTVTVTTPPPLRVTGSLLRPGELVVLLSSPLRRARPGPFCGRRSVSFPAPSEVAVARGFHACLARLSLAAEDGERAVVSVTVPAIPAIPPARTAPLYAFASAARRAIYITVDDGWTPSQRVLSIMERTRLRVTAFLIKEAAQQHLPYWRDFVQAGGTVGDHTVSHPDLQAVVRSCPGPWPAAVRCLRPNCRDGRLRGRAEGPGRLERNRRQPRNSYLEWRAPGAGGNRAPALGSGPGRPADRAAAGHPRPAPQPDASDDGQLRWHSPPAALARR